MMLLAVPVLLLSLTVVLDSSVGALPLLSHEDVILAPPEGKMGEPSILFFAQGASIKTSQYTTLAQQIQSAVPFPLYVGIPQCFEDNCAIPLTLSSGMKRARIAIEKLGVKVAKRTFHAGHSLGGAMLPAYVEGLEANRASDGLVLMGAFLTRKYKTGLTADGRPQVSFPVPTLTIGAELDGLCRVTRIAEALYSQVSFAADPQAAVRALPVTIVEGMNHMRFASGEAPKFVADNDLRSELDEDEAQARVAADVATFLTALEAREGQEHVAEAAWRALSARVQQSTKFAQPIIDALLMEGYFQFLPPCYCETDDEYGYPQFGTCETQPSCNGGTPWTGLFSQPIMGQREGLTVTARDSIHVVTEEKPSCHLPHIHSSQAKHNDPNWANPGSQEEDQDDLKFPPLCDKADGCELALTTVTEPYYENSGEFDIWRIHFSADWADTGYLPISATELKTKLKSRQAIWEAAGVANVSRAQTDFTVGQGGEGDRCREINDAAIAWAQRTVGADTLARFNAVGQRLVTSPDAYAVCAGGPCWIWDPLRFRRDDANNIASITAVAFSEPNTNPFPCGEGKALPCPAGMHYCMLFSPARAVEWMYVDGLRNKYSYQAPAPAPAPALKLTKLGHKQVKSPAFVSFDRGQLLVTQFAEVGEGNVLRLDNAGPLFASDPAAAAAAIASSSFATIGQGYTWPNLVERVADDVFSAEERGLLCGDLAGCDLYVVPDGFLTPGHKTGGLFLQPAPAPAPSSSASSSSSSSSSASTPSAPSTAATKTPIAPQQDGWFYHKAHFVDLDGDGLQDVIAARAHVSATGKARGELVWFRHPPSPAAVSSAWEMQTLAEGPDIMTLLLQPGAAGEIVVFSAQFFSEALSVTVLSTQGGQGQGQEGQEGGGPKVQCTGIVDAIKAEDLRLVDLDGDGRAELVANSHEGGAGGAIFAYQLPPADAPAVSYCTHAWAEGRSVVAQGAFAVRKRGPQQAAPGFFYPLALPRGTALLVAGDGWEAVHLVAPPAAGQSAFSASEVIIVGGTVGTLALGDVDGDGRLDLVVPDYDHDLLSFYAVEAA